MFDHPSALSFASTCSAVTGRSPAMSTGPGCCARAIMKPVPPISSAPPTRYMATRVMALSFVVQVSERRRTRRSAFKAELNGDPHRSQLGEHRIDRIEYGAFLSDACQLRLSAEQWRERWHDQRDSRKKQQDKDDFA